MARRGHISKIDVCPHWSTVDQPRSPYPGRSCSAKACNMGLGRYTCAGYCFIISCSKK